MQNIKLRQVGNYQVYYQVADDHSVYLPANMYSRTIAGVLDLTVISQIYKLIGIFYSHFAIYYGLDFGFFPSLPYVGLLVVAVCYFVAPTAFSGKTLGKSLMGLKTIHRNQDMSISFARSFARECLAKALSFAILPLSFFFMIGSKRNHAPHDVICGTEVVIEID